VPKGVIEGADHAAGTDPGSKVVLFFTAPIDFAP
jgi:hypothetical protein